VISVPHIVLLISDAPDAKTVRDALVNNSDGPFRVDWVRSRAEAVRRLATDTIPRKGRLGDLFRRDGADRVVAVLLDLYLPDSSGLETFVQLFRAAPKIPILILSAAQHEDVARLAVDQGAHDYLLRGQVDDYLLAKALRSMIEHAANTEALFDERERARVTLDSIGDAVICTDLWCRVTYLNVAAEKMTGWTRDQARDQPVDKVLRVIDAVTGKPTPNVMEQAIQENSTVAPTPNGVLVRRDGAKTAIEDSAAPIHDRRGAVAGAVVVFHDVTSARVLSQEMSYLAHHDSLTDLPNRLLFNDRLDHAMALAQRHRGKLAVLFLDIDRFKHVNDSLGHRIGDRLLQSVGQRLLGCVRRSDTVSRQGGDEFVILLPEVQDAQDAAVSAEKMLQALSGPYCIDQHELRVTASIGIVVFPDDGIEADEVLKHADIAMYHAKEQGRNNYRFFEPELNVRALERQSLELDLRRAIECEELVLHYQPKWNLQTGAIVGVEAFLRWRHPQRGLMLSAQFVPIAEACGRIVPIGRWVLREACKQLRAWRCAGMAPMRIAINISGPELRDKGFLSSLREILAETGMAAHDLELELTESVLIQDMAFASDVLGSLRDMGVKLALDDFGTGYSSLSHLKRLPIDILKIDSSFVGELTTDANASSIVGTVIGMGKNLGMQVVAEGVESREQLKCLQQLACPQGQGHYFGEAVAGEDFARLAHHKATA
jgi:diguanylate cyclase (GGDEF)-like protein/PAS domain S-box-containing protein